MNTGPLTRIIKEPPPPSNDGVNCEKGILNAYYWSFEEFFNKLAGHYNSRFKWFIDLIPQANRIVNFGIGKRGAETFALMWALDAVETIGFDKEDNCVKRAKEWRRKADKFANETVPRVRKFCAPKYAEILKSWYESKVSIKIRETILPTFELGDLTTGIEWESDYFDLAYSRYVLDKINENDRPFAVSEMVRVVKPGGHITIIAPEETFPNDLTDLKIKLIRTVDKDKLGKLENPEDPLRGNIYLKYL